MVTQIQKAPRGHRKEGTVSFLAVPKNSLLATANSPILSFSHLYFFSFQSVGCLAIPSETQEGFSEAPVQKRGTFPGRCISVTPEQVECSSLTDG